jgi:hypothetical protein
MACTFFPEGSWASCCVTHDKHYLKGSKVSRKDADQHLKHCVTEAGHPHIAKMMYAGVRTFGRFFYKGKLNN